MNLDRCEEHFAAARAARSVTELQPVLESLFNAYTPVGIVCPRLPPLWRVRKNMATRADFLTDMGPPPADTSRANRLNDAGASTFYGSDNLNTALVEIDAAEGDLIQIAAFRVKADQSVTLGLIGELHSAERIGGPRFPVQGENGQLKIHLKNLGDERAQVVQYIDAFFASVLSDPDAKDSDYFRTRMLCKAFFQRHPAEAIIYPTVHDVPGFNVALRGDAFDKLRPTVCTYAQVIRMREFGFFSVRNIDCAKGCDKVTGRFNWAPATPDNRYIHFDLNREEASAQYDWNAMRRP